MKVESYDLVNVAKNVLIQLGITDYRDVKLTYVLKEGNEWKVNFSYWKGIDFFQSVSSFAVNAQTGEITGMWVDRVWK